MSEMKVVVDGAVVQELLRKTNKLIEETRINLNALNQAVAAAEMMGWNDKNYYRFKDNFSIAKRHFDEGLSLMEEVISPELKRILNNIENFK